MTSPVRPPVRFRRMGDRALLVELDRLDDVLAIARALRAHPAPGQVDAIPAARTLLVRLGPDASLAAAERHVRGLGSGGARAVDSAHHRVDVVYDGADVAEVAALLGISERALVALHSSVPWTVAFTGFAPGFGYLVAPGLGLHVPRRITPRTSVPAGSVALADEFSGIYPRASPGGWQLIGRTDAVLWDVSRSRPALLSPGDTVEFRPVRELVAATARVRPRPADPPGSPALTVLDAGFSSTVQDRGRTGWGAVGVSPSGAADLRSYEAANDAVGNAAGAAAIEVTLGGLRIRADRELVVAVTGAATPAVTVAADGGRRSRARGRPFALRRGQTLELGAAETGLRAYVAVRGGLDVPAVLGSRSTDALSGLGPAPLGSGDVLTVGDEEAGAVALPVVDAPVPSAGPVTLRYLPGPRDDWFSDESRRMLDEQTWAVGTSSDRVGLRLQGSVPLERIRAGELPSEGMVAGALQVPPDGQPVLFLADHPVTGGYPVIGVVVHEDLAIAAQLPPGARFRLVREKL